MGLYNCVIFNIIFGVGLLLASAKTENKIFDERNDVITRKIENKSQNDMVFEEISKEDLKTLLNWVKALEKFQDYYLPYDENVDELLSLLNENSDRNAYSNQVVSESPASDDKNTLQISTEGTAEPIKVTESQTVAKRNPETELLKKLLSYKRKNRVSSVNRNLKCLLAGLPGC